MVKIKNVAILCLFIANLALSVKYGFGVLSIIALALSAIVLVWDFVDAVKKKEKKHE